VVTVACFIPAGLAVLVSPAEVRVERLRTVVQFLGYYLAFAIVAGVMVGFFRRGVRRLGGAVAVGALVGAVGFSALMYLPVSGPRHVKGTVVGIAALLGAGVGWHFWKGARRSGYLSSGGSDAR
jgi:hypothetical protein